MGVTYVVTPLGNYSRSDDEDKLRVHYESIGIALPPGEAPSRYPKASEIRSVLDGLEGYSITYSQDSYDWTAGIAHASDPENGPWTFLCAHLIDIRGDDDGPCDFFFEKGWQTLVVLIVEQLSRRCGPLILEDDIEFSPLLVRPGMDAQRAVREWDGREENWPYRVA